MKYLQKWSLFRESNGDDPPERDGDFSGIEWDSTPAEISVQKEADQKEGEKKGENSDKKTETKKSQNAKEGEDKKKTGIVNRDPKQKIWLSEGFVEDVLGLATSINEAFDPKSENYYFHHHARSAWRSLVFGSDDVEGAKKSFFGDNINDTTSWWYKNITSKISEIIELNSDPKKIVDNIGVSTEYLQKNLTTVEDVKKKAALKVCLDLVGRDIYEKLRQALKDRDNLFDYFDSTIGFEISVDPDFGIADNEKAKSSNTKTSINISITDRVSIVKAIDELIKAVDTLKNNTLFDVLVSILDLVDQMFKAKDVWKAYKGYWLTNDEDTEAARFVEKEFDGLKSKVIDPYIKKLQGLNIKQSDKDHFKREAERIRDNFFKWILERMRGNFDRTNIVEFRIQNWDKKGQKTVRINTDF